MKKLLKLKEWVLVADAARYISEVFEEQVSEADVLRFGLDGHLTLSVNFVNQAKARCGKVVPMAEAKVRPVTPIFGEPAPPILVGIPLRQDAVLELSEDVVSIDGVWDLPMLGSERLDVEHEFQNQTGGPAVELNCLDGTFVQRNEVICQLQEHFRDNDYFDKRKLKEPLNHPNNYYPAGGLPKDSVLVVRTAALIEFVNGNADPAVDAALGERERATLLTVIEALAREAEIDTSMPSKAGRLIEELTTRLGARVAARTIENHLKRVPEAIEKRGS